MMVNLMLPLLATCFAFVSAVPVNFKENYENSLNEKSDGLAFFDQFQRMFGWNDDPVTIEPTTSAPFTPPHAHTAPRTPSPYYGGHAHRGSYAPRAKPSPGPLLSSTKSPPPAPSMYQSTQRPYPYQYPAQPYYSPPYYSYNPYYPPPAYLGVPFYRANPTIIPTSTSSSLNSTTTDPPKVSETGEDDPYEPAKAHFPNKHVSEHRALPNKAPSKEPIFPVPFPVTKSFLPLSVLPPEDCHSEAGLVGECLSAAECGATSGQPSGLCHMGRDVSLHARVCCTYPAHCGYETNHRVTYLQSPGYPTPAAAVSDCPFTVNLLPGVCQVRLDFLDFQMKPLHQGQCDLKNSLLIKSGQSSTVIPMPRLCGTIASGQDDPLRTDIPHLYTHFDVDPAPEKNAKKVPNKDIINPTLELHFNVENYPSVWNIRVSQIVCDGANLQAPSGCSQFYNSNSGNITSINLPDGEYMTDTSLDICVARDPTACAIKYNLAQMDVGPTKGGLGYGLVCEDYLKLRGEKTGICGKAQGRDMILPLRGNVGLTFQSDSSNIPGADVGYRIEYEYLHNCDTIQYYKYPSTK